MMKMKILRKNLTTLAQTWSVLPFSNLALTFHTSDITLDRAKLIYGLVMQMNMNLGSLISSQISLIAHHDSLRLGFPSLITALCKARGVTSDSLTFEFLSPIKRIVGTWMTLRSLFGEPTNLGPEDLRHHLLQLPLPQLLLPLLFLQHQQLQFFWIPVFWVHLGRLA